jgi:hypothetical protein
MRGSGCLGCSGGACHADEALALRLRGLWKAHGQCGIQLESSGAAGRWARA